MAESMIERVARALHDAWLSEAATIQDMHANGPFPPWEEKSAETKARFYISARAAIEAMREPTEEMKDAGWFFAGSESGECFSAMIDAALKEQP